jgi:HTH-type transcriptional regulator/antitoxin HigA
VTKDGEKMTIATQPLTQAWGTLQTLIPVFPIRNERQYERALNTLSDLLDIVNDDESHPLYNLLDTLGVLVHAYEEGHYPAPQVSGIDVLRFLMNEHNLTPSDLPELGDASVVSELLAGERPLSVEHIRALSQRFGLSPATFI